MLMRYIRALTFVSVMAIGGCVNATSRVFNNGPAIAPLSCPEDSEPLQLGLAPTNKNPDTLVTFNNQDKLSLVKPNEDTSVRLDACMGVGTDAINIRDVVYRVKGDTIAVQDFSVAPGFELGPHFFEQKEFRMTATLANGLRLVIRSWDHNSTPLVTLSTHAPKSNEIDLPDDQTPVLYGKLNEGNPFQRCFDVSGVPGNTQFTLGTATLKMNVCFGFFASPGTFSYRLRSGTVVDTNGHVPAKVKQPVNIKEADLSKSVIFHHNACDYFRAETDLAVYEAVADGFDPGNGCTAAQTVPRKSYRITYKDGAVVSGPLPKNYLFKKSTIVPE